MGGQRSATRIVWMDSLNKSFENAKLLARNPIGIAEPRPGDHLHTYSDYSAENNEVGGRLLIIRKAGDKTEDKRLWIPLSLINKKNA